MSHLQNFRYPNHREFLIDDVAYREHRYCREKWSHRIPNFRRDQDLKVAPIFDTLESDKFDLAQ